MPSHKSPSSQRWLANRERREILATRRASAESAKEGTQYTFASALPRHPKMGRHFSNPSSSRTITGGNMKDRPYDYRKVTRTIDRPLGQQGWELLAP